MVAAKTNKKIKSISKEVVEILKQHQWNGNIRELKNVMERAVILITEDAITIENLPFELQHTVSSSKQLSAFDMASAEKIHIQKVLNYTNGNKTETAKLLNIALTTLYRKIEEYKL